MARLRVLHETRFTYPRPVADNRNQVRLTPVDDDAQTRVTHRLLIEPEAHVSPYRDRYGNTAHLVHIGPRHSSLLIRAESVVEVQDATPMRFTGPPTFADLANADLEPVSEFLDPSFFCSVTPELRDFLRDLASSPDMPLVEFLDRLNARIATGLEYRPGETTVHTRAADVILERRGVCQDFAHIMITASRAVGIPARYVSGYLLGEGFSHAWMEAWVPGHGWTGFDPTHHCRPNGGGYVRAAVGRDFGDVSPVVGTYWEREPGGGGGTERVAGQPGTMTVRVSVARAETEEEASHVATQRVV